MDNYHAVLAMQPLYEVLFLFSAPQGYLAEIKRLDQPANAPKTNIYHWLWIQATTVTALQFVGMVTSPQQQRIFREALLWFDDQQGALHWTGGPTVPLVTEADKTLPPALVGLVNLHLS